MHLDSKLETMAWKLGVIEKSQACIHYFRSKYEARQAGRRERTLARTHRTMESVDSLTAFIDFAKRSNCWKFVNLKYWKLASFLANNLARMTKKKEQTFFGTENASHFVLCHSLVYLCVSENKYETNFAFEVWIWCAFEAHSQSHSQSSAKLLL